jgi:hypothetical protein
MSGPLFCPDRDGSWNTRFHLASDDLLEQVGHAQGEQVHGLVQRLSPQKLLSVSRPPAIAHPYALLLGYTRPSWSVVLLAMPLAFL